MQTALAVGSLLPAGIGLGCCLHRRVHWLGLTAMLAMVGGMADAMLLGHHLLPAAGWVVVFALAAAAQYLAAEPTRAFRIAELAVMSLLMVAMPPMTTEPTGGMHHHMGHPEMSDMSTASPSTASLLVLFGLAAAFAYLAHAAWRLVVEEASFSRLELGMSVASVAAMSAMMVV